VSLISIWTGISVALVEIVIGVFAGNVLGIHARRNGSIFWPCSAAGCLRSWLAQRSIRVH
jgi:hypothetical protein